MLQSSTLMTQVSTADLAGRVQGVPLAASFIQYPFKAYRLTYRTRNTDGQEVTASGAVLVPTTTAPTPLPLLSYQHGTLLPSSETQALSYYAPAPTWARWCRW